MENETYFSETAEQMHAGGAEYDERSEVLREINELNENE